MSCLGFDAPYLLIYLLTHLYLDLVTACVFDTPDRTASTRQQKLLMSLLFYYYCHQQYVMLGESEDREWNRQNLLKLAIRLFQWTTSLVIVDS